MELMLAAHYSTTGLSRYRLKADRTLGFDVAHFVLLLNQSLL
jgi:hypothetical protein